MKIIPLSTIAFLSFILLNSCSSKLSKSELAAISSASVNKATMAPASYQYPSPFEHGDDGRAIQSSTGTMGSLIGIATASDDLGGYLVGGLLGHAVGHGITSNQKESFKQNYGRYFSSLRGKVPSNLTTMASSAVESNLKTNRFFAPRLRNQGTHQFSVSIQKHFLARYGSDPRTKQPLMSAHIELRITLHGPGRRVIYDRTFTGKSRSALNIPTLASSNEANRRLFSEAINSACQKFSRDIRSKTGG